MKRFLMLMLSAVLITSCAKSDLEKANDLLAKYHHKLNTVESIDSLIGYQDCLECSIRAAEIYNMADSISDEAMRILQQMKDDGKTNEMYEYAENIKNKVVSMYDEAFRNKKDENFNLFNHQISGDKGSFIGFQSISKGDSVSYKVVFNKDLSKILMIEKIKQE